MSSQFCHFSEFLTQRVCCLRIVWKFCPAKQLHNGEAMLVYSSDPWTFWGGRTCVLEVAFSHSCPLPLVVTSVLFVVWDVKQLIGSSAFQVMLWASPACPQMLTKLANIAEPGLLRVSEMVFLKWCFTRWMSQRAAGPSCTFPLPTSFPWGWGHKQVQASQHHLGAPFHRKYKVGYSVF